MKKIAFFAPIKPPDHPIPSGDRLIAGNLLKALDIAGFETELASRYICYSKRSQSEYLEDRKAGALKEAERLIRDYQEREKSDLPDLWITYHPYCKAPDWIGPLVSKHFGIPYITIEAAKTGQGVNDEWGPWRNEAQHGIRQADMHLCFKPSDRDYLNELLGGTKRLRDFPAFIDTRGHDAVQAANLPGHWHPGTPTIITTGMMRPGKKVRNFEILAEVVSSISELNWNMVVVGGGPEEARIRQLFSAIEPDRIHWTGLVETTEVLSWMRAADIFFWPGWREPIGMVYLEAQLQQLPVIASRSLGVPLVVDHQQTGLLSPENDTLEMSKNLAMLLADEPLRKRFGLAAKKKVLEHHSLNAAAGCIKRLLSEFES